MKPLRSRHEGCPCAESYSYAFITLAAAVTVCSMSAARVRRGKETRLELRWREVDALRPACHESTS